jgi:hypothetical protein
MRNLKFICAQPDDTYYTWQVHLWLESLKKIGHSDKAIVLIFIPNFREKNEKWQQVIDLYPETEFVFYKDVDGVSSKLGVYIPVLRPYVLMKYFYEHPEMKQKAVLYCDSDVLFTDKFNVDTFIDDEVNYLSDTNSYINASYFDSKIHQVLPDKLEAYKKLDVLAQATEMCGITREIAEANNDHSGGAQYLLKNIDGAFWEKVLRDCISIRTYLLNINRLYFKDEDSGFQSWCADMWAVLWALWFRGAETKNIPELEFSWSSDPIDKVHRLGILHNAGIVSNDMGDYPAFYKGHYHIGADPFQDPHLEYVYNDERAKGKGTHYYVEQMIKLKEKYNLNY